MVKSLEFFLKLQQVLHKRNLVVSVESYSISPARHGKSFVLVFFQGLSLSIDHLFNNLKPGKRNYIFGKSLEKVLNFSQKSVRTLKNVRENRSWYGFQSTPSPSVNTDTEGVMESVRINEVSVSAGLNLEKI